MRERVELLVGRATRAMWVMTFHSACARMLRADAHRLGYTRQFTIYDSADQRRLIKKCLDDLDIDPKRFTPRAMQVQISDAKNKLRAADDYRQLVGSFFEQTVADVYEAYERELHRANAMDFDDLLVPRGQPARALPGGPRPLHERVPLDPRRRVPGHQPRPVPLAPAARSEHRNLAVVGDDDQCLVEGTLVTMADGSSEADRGGRRGRRGAVLLRQRRLPAGAGDATSSSASERRRRDHDRERAADRQHARAHALRRLPPGARRPQLHLTYLMRRQDRASGSGRRGRTPTASAKPVIGVALRAMQEHADAAGSSRRTQPRPRRGPSEAMLSLRYQLADAAVRRAPDGSASGLVGDQALIDRVFESVDTYDRAVQLLLDRGLSLRRSRTTCRAASKDGGGTSTITLCGDRRGRTPMHIVAVGGRDAEARAALERLGLNVRPAKAGVGGWRYESCFKDFGEAMDVVERIESVLAVSCPAGRAPRRAASRESGNSAAVHAARRRSGPGMVDVRRGRRLRRRRVGRAGRARRRRVYDLDVEDTHNFIADGLVTHNSIYSFRGADITQHPQFRGRLPGRPRRQARAELPLDADDPDAANAVVANNRGRKAKSLWTDIGEGDPIKVRELADEHAEARFVAAEIERLVDEGVSRARDRGLLPHERAVAGARGHARARADRLPGDRRHEVLRARRDQGRDRLPDVPRQPAGRRRVHAHRQLAAARDRADVALARARARGHDGDHAVWEAAAAPGTCRRSAPRRRRRSAASCRRWSGCAERAEAGAPVGELLEETLRETGYLEALEAERTIEAQGRIENLEELVRVGARVRRARPRGRGPARRSSCSRSRCSPTPTDPRRRGPRDADDAPQRQGPRVPDRVHHRLRGRRLPAQPRARRGLARGGAAARLRRHHARDARPLRSPTRAGATCSAAAVLRAALALPRRDPARAHRPGRRSAAASALPDGPRRVVGGAAAARRGGRADGGDAAGRSSAWATTSSTRRSARASSSAPSPAASSSCASPATARAQADGRLRADPQALTPARPRPRRARLRRAARAAARCRHEPADLEPRHRRPARAGAARHSGRPAGVRPVGAGRPGLRARADRGPRSSLGPRPGALRPGRPFARRRRGAGDGDAASGGCAAARAGLARRPRPAGHAAWRARSASPPSRRCTPAGRSATGSPAARAGARRCSGTTVADAARLHPADARLLLDASSGARRVSSGVRRALEADLRDDLAAAPMPVGLIWGDADLIVPYWGWRPSATPAPRCASWRRCRRRATSRRSSAPAAFTAALERILAGLTER